MNQEIITWIYANACTTRVNVQYVHTEEKKKKKKEYLKHTALTSSFESESELL